MPDIAFFTPPRLTVENTYERRDNITEISFGGWIFTLKSVKPIYGIAHIAGMYGLVGFEETYSNPDITQEETDAIWRKYLEDTGLADQEGD